MSVVDSSGWLEYFTDGPLAKRYEPYLRKAHDLVTPTIILYEVYKKLKHEKGEELALLAAAQLGKTVLVPLSEALALEAADLSLEHKLPMADAIVYATALAYQRKLITSDADFKGLPNVLYFARS